MDSFLVTVGTTLAALFTIMIYSILYKENVLYRFAEHTAIGVGVGYGICTTLRSLRTSTYNPLMGGNLMLLVPIFLGILAYTFFIKKIAWLSLWPTGVLTGIGVGLALRGAIQAQFVQQIDATLILLKGSATDMVNNLIVVITTVTVLYYFLFTLKFKSASINSASDNVRKLARCFIMVALGVTFSGATLSWIVNIIARIQFLLFDWLRI